LSIHVHLLKLVQINVNREKCTPDSQCLSNKCVDNHCVFNEVTPITRCYASSNSKMHGGRALNDICKSNGDCSTDYCNEGICEYKPEKEGQITGNAYLYVFIDMCIFFFIPVVLCLCCYLCP